MKNNMYKLCFAGSLMLLPFISQAGGIKGSLISDQTLHWIAFFLVLIYLSSLALSIVKNRIGTKWCGILGFILTSIIFFPSIFLAMVFPEVGLPLILISGFNFILLWRKPKPTE